MRLGSAILGSVLGSAYQSRLQLAGLPAPLAGLARQSAFGGVAVARQLCSAALLPSVRAAFVDGTDLALTVSASIALAGVILAMVFLPGRPMAGRETSTEVVAPAVMHAGIVPELPGELSNTVEYILPVAVYTWRLCDEDTRGC